MAEEDVAEEASIPPIIRRRRDCRTFHLTLCFLFSSASASFAFHFFDFVREFFPFFVCMLPKRSDCHRSEGHGASHVRRKESALSRHL